MLRSRSFWTFLGVIVFLTGSSLLAAIILLVNPMDRLEQHLVQNGLQTVRALVDAEQVKLVRTTRDWAFWDATYQFIVDLNEEYIHGNITPETFESLHIKGILFYDAARNLVIRRHSIPRRAKRPVFLRTSWMPFRRPLPCLLPKIPKIAPAASWLTVVRACSWPPAPS